MKKIFLFCFLFFFGISIAKAENIENIFNDINKSYAFYEELKVLYERGIILPDKNGNFNPKEYLTRDEFVGIVSEISCKECIKPNTDFSLVQKYHDSSIFFDISPEDKYFYCIAEANNSGQVTGYQAGTVCQDGSSKAGEKPFCPANNILLEEALAIILRAGNILSIKEAEDLRNQIRNGTSFPNIGNIAPFLSNGDIYSFYPDFKKAHDYIFVDYDKNGNEKRLKLLDFSGDINPKKFVTREDFLRISYIALKNNSCQTKNRQNNFGAKIEIFDKICTENQNNCQNANLKNGEKIFDFKGNISRFDDKDFTYNWRFYDYSTGNEILKNGKYIDNYDFLKDGNYRVFLNVISPDGEKSEVFTDIQINSNLKDKEEKNLDFYVKIQKNKENISPLEKITFIGNSNGEGVTYSWDFGDGKKSETPNKIQTHSYEKDGTYTVTVTATDKYGNKKTDSTTIIVGNGENNFSVDIKKDKNNVSSGENINFSGISDNSDIKYYWNFGDGETASGENISHSFQKDGTYTIVLQGTDKNGNTSSASTTINIGNGNNNDGLTSYIIVDKIGIRPGEKINLTGVTNTNSGDEKYSWDFGDGKSGIGQQTSTSFSSNGVYTITLNVSNNNGNTYSSTVNISVSTNPEFEGNKNDSDGDGVPDEFDYEKETPKEKINFICTVELIEKKLYTCKETDLGVYKPEIEKNYNDSVDSDGDGVSDKNDKCPTIKGDKKNFGCPIFEKSCEADNDCKSGEFCENGFCKVKKYSLNCAYNGGDIITGNIECNSCPCQYDFNFNASIRACDIIFPAITSPDKTEIYSKGKYFQIKK